MHTGMHVYKQHYPQTVALKFHRVNIAIVQPEASFHFLRQGLPGYLRICYVEFAMAWIYRDLPVPAPWVTAIVSLEYSYNMVLEWK